MIMKKSTQGLVKKLTKLKSKGNKRGNKEFIKKYSLIIQELLLQKKLLTIEEYIFLIKENGKMLLRHSVFLKNIIQISQSLIQ